MTDTPTGGTAQTLDEATRDRLQAAAFRRLLSHLQERTDVQNIDLMTLGGFCRNCLSTWLDDAARAEGIAMGKDAAREHVYGMPYADWKARYQVEATPEQQAAFEAATRSSESA